MSEKQRINVYLPTKVVAAAKLHKRRSGVAFSEQVRLALVRYLKDELPKAPKA